MNRHESGCILKTENCLLPGLGQGEQQLHNFLKSLHVFSHTDGHVASNTLFL